MGGALRRDDLSEGHARLPQQHRRVQALKAVATVVAVSYYRPSFVEDDGCLGVGAGVPFNWRSEGGKNGGIGGWRAAGKRMIMLC